MRAHTRTQTNEIQITRAEFRVKRNIGTMQTMLAARRADTARGTSRSQQNRIELSQARAHSGRRVTHAGVVVGEREVVAVHDEVLVRAPRVPHVCAGMRVGRMEIPKRHAATRNGAAMLQLPYTRHAVREHDTRRSGTRTMRRGKHYNCVKCKYKYKYKIFM
jgi:hypothetical protein